MKRGSAGCTARRVLRVWGLSPATGGISQASATRLAIVLTIAGYILATGSGADAAASDGKLPPALDPWGMFLQADAVVRSVMVGLAFASFVTWTVWLAKTVELFNARRAMVGALRRLAAARSLEEAQAASPPVARLLAGARSELAASPVGASPAGIKERVASRLERLEGEAARRIAIGTGLLATIGSTSPFVGLFGTVWGIMNSFVGIAKSQTTNLAVVAPGIAEALLATALGLVAAIPAVVIYNVFARQIATHRALLGDASAAIRRLVSRELDRDAGREPSVRQPRLVGAE